MERYRDERGTSCFDLAAFVQRNFIAQCTKVGVPLQTGERMVL
jgi:hypothetical protein